MPYDRQVSIGGTDFTSICDQSNFVWNWRGGCDAATLKISAGAFDETFGIDIEDDVQLSYESGAVWWRGVVVDLHTDLTGGLTIQCAGTKIFLDEIIPTGRFGAKIETTRPTDIETTAAAAGANAPGLTQTDHIFVVTAIDAEGETWGGTIKSGETSGTSPTASIPFVKETIATASQQITVAWVASTQGATGYKVYANLSADGTADADFTSAGGMVVYDVVGTSLVVDGSRDGEPADFPFASAAAETSITPTISDTAITDCVDHLLDTYLPSQLTKGTVSLTNDETLNAFDLTDNNDSLQRVLDSLVLLSNDDAHWYVDASNQVHFVDKSSTVLGTFALKKASGDITNETNLLVGLSRRRTRDGVSTVKIQGEPDYEEGSDNPQLSYEAITWDGTTDPSSVDGEYVELTKDPRVISDAPPRNPNADIPIFASGSTARTWITDNYATLQAWLNVYPNFRALWIMANDTAMSDHSFTSILNSIRTRYWKATVEALNGSQTFGQRPKVKVVRAPGIKSTADGVKAGHAWLGRRNPNPDTWKMKLDQVDTLFVPGQGTFKVVTDLGKVYTLELRQLRYTFGNSVELECDVGDEEVEVERETKRTTEFLQVNVAMRKTNAPTWKGYNC